MKTLSLLVIALCLISCHESNTFNVTRIIKNDTDFDVQIFIYGLGTTIDELEVKNNSSDTASSFCLVERGRLADCPVVFGLFSVDSAEIRFDNQRSITYCSQDMGCIINKKSILSLDVFEENELGYVEVSENTYVFTISEEDYNLAK